MELIVDNEQELFTDVESFEKLIEAAVLKSLELEDVATDLEISVLLVDNAGIREINREHRQLDKATDVLSFPQFNGKEELRDAHYAALGDIVISLERAGEQAQEYGHSIEREIGFLTVHSVLHLLGYDHDTEERTAIMQAREKAILHAMKLTRD